jgi:hypothetical protein
MFILPLNDFHPFHAFLGQELDNTPLLHFHERWRVLGMALVISAGLGGHSP